MFGIRFEIPNEYDKFLQKIFRNIKTKHNTWRIVADEIIKEDGNWLFTKDRYNDKEFRNLISMNNYYLIFARIECYKNNNFSNIADYTSFINSDCKLLIVIIDSIFVDIYVKEEEILEQLSLNAIKNNFIKIELISEDQRNAFNYGLK